MFRRMGRFRSFRFSLAVINFSSWCGVGAGVGVGVGVEDGKRCRERSDSRGEGAWAIRKWSRDAVEAG